MYRVLFVCTGNTCRSPMAEAILRSKNIPEVEVRSAGIYASPGMDASGNAKIILAENQISHNHQSSQLDAELIQWATHIFTMTTGHKAAISTHFPDAIAKTYTLKEFSELGNVSDIADPYGGSVEVYRGAFLEIQTAIGKMVARLSEKEF